MISTERNALGPAHLRAALAGMKRAALVCALLITGVVTSGHAQEIIKAGLWQFTSQGGPQEGGAADWLQLYQLHRPGADCAGRSQLVLPGRWHEPQGDGYHLGNDLQHAARDVPVQRGGAVRRGDDGRNADDRGSGIRRSGGAADKRPLSRTMQAMKEATKWR
jgi:hypothetical protein